MLNQIFCWRRSKGDNFKLLNNPFWILTFIFFYKKHLSKCNSNKNVTKVFETKEFFKLPKIKFYWSQKLTKNAFVKILFQCWKFFLVNMFFFHKIFTSDQFKKKLVNKGFTSVLPMYLLTSLAERLVWNYACWKNMFAICPGKIYSFNILGSKFCKYQLVFTSLYISSDFPQVAQKMEKCKCNDDVQQQVVQIF